MNMRSFNILTLSILLCGCAASRLQEPPSADRICCTSFADMAFQVLPYDQDRKIHLDAKSSTAFQFPQGRSVFVAFKLPSDHGGTSLRVSTYLSGAGYLPSATILLPRIVFLNENKEAVISKNDIRFQQKSAFLVGTYFEAQVSIPTDASYFIVYSTPSEGRKVIVYSENGRPYDIPISHSGVLNVRIIK
jgi:hypothetical protein